MKATITSKGQITIPKTVRDVLKLKDKDEVEFHILSNGTVSFQKAKEYDTPFNILDMLLELNMKVFVVGTIGHGKSAVVREAIERKGYQNVLLREPFPEYEEVFKEKNITKPSDESYTDYLTGHNTNEFQNVEVAIIEEINRFSIKPQQLKPLNHPLIMTTHVSSVAHFLQIHSHSPFPVIPNVIVTVNNCKIMEIVKVKSENLNDIVYLYRSDDNI